MPCEVLHVDPLTPAADAMARAAYVLRNRGLVAFPTETVYGIGAHALDPSAVARIYVAKGRPALNPIIVHIATIDDARKLVADWPAAAQMLAERFWPGPLTLVLTRRPEVPDIVTAGGPTVALRMPAHPVALALLQTFGMPVAAPSANRSTELSPTLPEHVLHGLGDRIDLLLDAGPTTGGLESTVLDVTTAPPRLLRPGLVTIGQLEAVVGPVARTLTPPAEGPARSPGLLARHYAPRTPLEVVAGSKARIEALLGEGRRVGWLTHRPEDEVASTDVLHILLPADSVSYSARIYAALHRLDSLGLDRIVVELPPAGDDWLAVHDRLRRAATV